MRSICPDCGSPMNPRRVGVHWFAPTPQRHKEWGEWVYDCTNLDCKRATFVPPQVHEDRVEWFFERVVWPLICVAGALFVIAFVAQILGLL